MHSFCVGLHIPKEEGLPADVVNRLKSYEAVKDVPFKVTLVCLPACLPVSRQM